MTCGMRARILLLRIGLGFRRVLRCGEGWAGWGVWGGSEMRMGEVYRLRKNDPQSCLWRIGPTYTLRGLFVGDFG